MKYLFDTISLVSLYRFIYVPCRNKDTLVAFFEEQIEDERFFILEGVIKEIAKHEPKLLADLFPIFDTDKHLIVKEKALVPAPDFIRALNDPLLSPLGKSLKRTDPTAFEARRRDFMRTADPQLIIMALELASNNEPVALVSEESRRLNDNKDFVKLPLMCDYFGIDYFSITEVLQHFGADITMNYTG